MSSKSARAGDDSQQVQVEGDNHAPVTMAGTIAVNGDVSGGITIQSAPDREGDTHTFDIKKKVRIPISATAIGVTSSIISIIGFITGSKSLKDFFKVVSSTARIDSLHYFSSGIVGGIIILLSLCTLILGIRCCIFLRKNILHLPRNWHFPAFAGIRGEDGRTFPYLLKLSLKCPECADRNLRFERVRSGSEWVPMAVCPRHRGHSLLVDVSKNDFDSPLPR